MKRYKLKDYNDMTHSEQLWLYKHGYVLHENRKMELISDSGETTYIDYSNPNSKKELSVDDCLMLLNNGFFEEDK